VSCVYKIENSVRWFVYTRRRSVTGELCIQDRELYPVDCVHKTEECNWWVVYTRKRIMSGGLCTQDGGV
jgi:hypothetical protein